MSVRRGESDASPGAICTGTAVASPSTMVWPSYVFAIRYSPPAHQYDSGWLMVSMNRFALSAVL